MGKDRRAEREQRDGTEQVVNIKGKDYVRRVDTKRGADGVEEVHLNHTEYKKKIYSYKK